MVLHECCEGTVQYICTYLPFTYVNQTVWPQGFPLKSHKSSTVYYCSALLRLLLSTSLMLLYMIPSE